MVAWSVVVASRRVAGRASWLVASSSHRGVRRGVVGRLVVVALVVVVRRGRVGVRGRRVGRSSRVVAGCVASVVRQCGVARRVVVASRGVRVGRRVAWRRRRASRRWFAQVVVGRVAVVVALVACASRSRGRRRRSLVRVVRSAWRRVVASSSCVAWLVA
ncbi:hypothetical protein ACXZ9C_10525 [Streptococcus agalactiae]